MEKNWGELSADEKQEAMFESWLSPQGIEFDNAEAEKAYKERVTRFKDAIQLKEPDRVPINPVLGFFPAIYAGMTPQEVMYDYDKLYMASKKYVLEFEPDVQGGIGGPTPGKVYDILDYKLYAWPGHGVSPKHGYQCIEREYMAAEEYDDLIQDPSYYFTSTYFPRIFGALEAFRNLPNFANVQEIPFVAPNIMPFGMPEVQDAYKALFEAGNEAMRWRGYVGKFGQEMAAAGFPGFSGGFSKAPFDVIGDTLRGTKGIMMDLYRRPNKLLDALEAITPLMIKMGISVAKRSGRPIVTLPLHKGADGFLSDEQFKKFYWPTFRKVLIGLIEEGCVPFLFVEGSYNSRLEVIRDLPKGKVIWGFDQTDMARAKEVLGDVACIAGNVPTTILSVGMPRDVEHRVKELIDTAGEGGGYIMMNGASLDHAKPENFRAMIETTKGYGRYR
ncbi:MAG: uroporphyrinogen decarboxylase family protein [Dehalococcoidia bacterium]